MKLESYLGKSSSYGKVQEILFGIEYEIESILTWADVGPYFNIIEDSSLRNNGKEFVSFPSTFLSTLNQFKFLHSNLKLDNKTDAFSERTSIHVHVNCLNLEIRTINNILLAYLYAEPLIFKFIGRNREHNIYCVPLSYTTFNTTIPLGIAKILDKWHKYTALNLCRIHDLGTMEFRHLHGTNDFEKFKLWLTIINELFLYFINNPKVEVYDLLLKDKNEFLNLIFPSLVSQFSSTDIEELTKDSYLDLCLTFI